MLHRIIGAFMIAGSCLGICFAIWHLVDQLKTPKNERIWWAWDAVIQIFFYPVCIFGIIIGIYQFMV